jgi:signal transduction histidine kinase
VFVKDDGIGMSPSHVANLFSRQNATTSRGTQGERGTGLGLILCQEMVENNGGKISVTSEEGKGSTFHVFLKSNEGAK